MQPYTDESRTSRLQPDYTEEEFCAYSAAILARERAAACGPTRENGTTSAVVAPVVPGGSVRTSVQPNLDRTGTRTVRKGCTVEFPFTGTRAKVVRVHKGAFWTEDAPPPAMASFTPCCVVRVVTTIRARRTDPLTPQDEREFQGVRS